jgi:parvulin-like peptidyl-prolyl isomerase
MFFSSKPGEVIGPLFLDEYAMLFKVIEYDTLYRVRASHLYLKPDGKSRKDTLNAIKKANKYLKEIQEGANFEEMAKKYSQDETAAQGGDLGWLWQGMTIKEFDQVLANGKKGDIVVIKSALGAHIVKITEDKVYDRGRVKVVPLMRKI